MGINYKACWLELRTEIKESAKDYDPDPTWNELLEKVWELEDKHKQDEEIIYSPDNFTGTIPNGVV